MESQFFLVLPLLQLSQYLCICATVPLNFSFPSFRLVPATLLKSINPSSAANARTCQGLARPLRQQGSAPYTLKNSPMYRFQFFIPTNIACADSGVDILVVGPIFYHENPYTYL